LPIPTGFIIKAIENPQIRLRLILVLGLAFQYFLYDYCILLIKIKIDVVMAWLEILIGYGIMVFINRKYVGGVMTIFSLFYLIFAHIERMITDYGGWHLGVSTSIMIQCISLSMVAWDYTDGLLLLEKEKADLDTKKTEITPKTQTISKSAVKERPTFIEFFACIVCPTHSFAGPCSNYKDFRDFVYHEGDFKEIPSTVIPCLKRFGTGLISIVLYVTLHKFFPAELLRTSDFKEKDFLTRVFYRSYIQKIA